jgi:hypothetical protein
LAYSVSRKKYDVNTNSNTGTSIKADWDRLQRGYLHDSRNSKCAGILPTPRFCSATGWSAPLKLHVCNLLIAAIFAFDRRRLYAVKESIFSINARLLQFQTLENDFAKKSELSNYVVSSYSISGPRSDESGSYFQVFAISGSLEYDRIVVF